MAIDLLRTVGVTGLTLAALAVCDQGALAATVVQAAPNDSLCRSAPATAAGLTNFCAPEAVVNVMGSATQHAAMQAQLTRADGPVFDINRPLAVITGGSTLWTASAPGVPGIAYSRIYYGYGRGAYEKTLNPYGGKRLAVVLNTGYGAYTGLNAMVNTVRTADPLATGTASGGIFFNETVTTKLLSTNDTAPLGCAQSPYPYSSSPYPNAANVFLVTCSDPSAYRDYVNELRPGTKTPRGVQLVALDLPPEFAPPGVVSAKYKAASFPMTETGVQGFGIAVNDKLLAALIARDIASKSLAASCAAVTSAANLTPDCQPGIARAEVAQFVSGKGNAATLFGAVDTTPVVYYRRTPFAGGQAASNIALGGQGVSLLLDKSLKPYAALAYKTPVLGELSCYFVNAPQSQCGWSWYSSGSATGANALTVKGTVGGGDALNAIKASNDLYALGLFSMSHVIYPGRFPYGQFVSWVKVDGISPNSDGSNWDTKQRIGFAKGYPLQFNMVAATNAATKDVGQTKVVNALIAALKDPAYDLPGVAYLDAAAVSAAGTNNLAPYTRTINAYAPLTLNK
jgi:hypothetical protein